MHLQGDISRRTMHIRLNTSEERPETRSAFKYSRAPAHVRANRGPLVSAALTILRAGCCRAAHEDNPGLLIRRVVESVRQTVAWLGMPDPAETQDELMAANDTQVNAIGELLEGLDEYIKMNGNTAVTSGQIARALETDDRKLYERLHLGGR